MDEMLRRKIGALFMTGVPKQSLQEEFFSLCKAYRIGHFNISSDNALSVESLCELTASLRTLAYDYSGTYPIIAIDQEGGWVTRFYCGCASIPGPMSYAAAGADGEKMYAVGQRLGRILRAVGCNAVDAPVLDVNIDPNNPIIGTRAYSDKTQVVRSLGVSFASGLESVHVLSAVKHFPGHGNVSADTHTGAAVNSNSLQFLKEKEFSPFQAAFDSGVGGIMTAHVTYPSLSDRPATLSHEIMTDLVRTEMGFDGIIITDSMGMHAVQDPYPNGEEAVLALEAGCDVILYYPYSPSLLKEAVEAVYRAVESGRITQERIDASFARIARQKEKYCIASAHPDVSLASALVYDKEVLDEIFREKLASITCLKDDGILKDIKDRKLLCIAPVCDALRGVEEKRRKVLCFAEEFCKEFPGAVPCVSSLSGVTEAFCRGRGLGVRIGHILKS